MHAMDGWGKAYFKRWKMNFEKGTQPKQNGIKTQGEAENHVYDNEKQGRV